MQFRSEPHPAFSHRAVIAVAFDLTIHTCFINLEREGTPFRFLTLGFVKPLIWQEREGYQLQAVNSQNDFKVFLSDIYHFGIRARVNAGFGLWQLAFGSKAELTPANYAAARAAMMKLRGDQGRILGIKPTVLVVGPELEEMGHRIVNSENSTGGDTNPWKDSASLIVSPYLGA
ncbi:Mu-like prophage major head subunit gpT family protein [Thioclava sp. A2]|uniref:Mu-like prophage major head subunit gpT family protein n=1 Tax=Thioclava sp. FCG-A2 TaxID=3080562 RepID=UPI0029534FB4|nr:Mu-like prophage major head subunit gpT family protein [Thioclava sp. A2]MDV7270830.1 Mu-like prophage major head subunit gpT family protein [Thioclava sp. A2]